MNIISTKQINTSIKEFWNKNFDLNYDKCAQNFENNQERSTYSNIQDFHISISLQNVQDFDIEIDANKKFVKKFASFNSNLMKNDNIRISSYSLSKSMFDFSMILNFWCEKKNIMRKIYKNLLKVLHLINCSKTRILSNRLNTLHMWYRKRFSFSIIQNFIVSIRTNKQSTKIFKFAQIIMYYFDIKTLINIVLFDFMKTFHIEIIEFVNFFSKYWHSNCWDSSIKTCSNDYVQYSDQFLIFSFDIIRYFCDNQNCSTTHIHYEQVTFFNRDKRNQFETFDMIFLKIRSIICEINFIDYKSLNSYDWSENEFFFIENVDEHILFHQMFEKCTNIKICRNDISIFSKIKFVN